MAVFATAPTGARMEVREALLQFERRIAARCISVTHRAALRENHDFRGPAVRKFLIS
jgi:hypothetical protein